MCGIFGSFGVIDKNLLRKSTKLLKHRGPDSEGYYIDDHVMLGVRRLKIVDSEKGDQPLYSEDSSIVVIFNGEIYNYKQLRKILKKRNHRFNTNSDCEVIIHAYEEFGPEFINLINGMFSIAIWDSNKKELYIFRDRFGIKPLYYYIEQNKNIIIFSSEITPILKYDQIPKQLNKEKLPEYLIYRYIKSPNTFIKSIKKLEPGSYLKINKDSIENKKYYKLSLSETTNYRGKNLYNLIKNSVQLRSEEVKNPGVFLSGGIDSTIIVSLLNKLDKDVSTYTIGFEDSKNVSDRVCARKVSDFYNTKHKEILFNSEDAIKSIPEVVKHIEEPLADATAISSFLLSKVASKNSKVILSGDGGDELFRGYVTYQNMRNFKRLQKIPTQILKKKSLELFCHFPREISRKFFNYPDYIGKEGKKRIRNLNKLNEKQAYNSMQSLFYKDVTKILKNSKQKITPNQNYYPNIYDQIHFDFMSNWLSDNVLTRVDKMSMAHSIEARVPFLDHNISNYSLNFKRKKFNKYLLKKTFIKDVPNFIIKRKKSPFYIPISDWFNKNLKNYYISYFEDSTLVNEKVYDLKYIKKLIKTHNSSKLVNSRKLWSLMILDSCYEKFILN